MRIRHLNRGDVKAGGCTFCKPRHKRFETIIPTPFLIEEGLTEYDDETQEDHESDSASNNRDPAGG